MSRNKSGIGAALISALGFSTLGIFASSLYAKGYSIPQTLAWRFTLAATFLWCVNSVRFASGWRMGASRRGLVSLFLLALFGFTPQAGLYFLTVKLLAPGITGMLLYLYPAFVLMIYWLFLGRKPNAGQLLALGLSLVGCVVTFFEPGEYPPAGLALGVLVAVAYGAYLVWGERILHEFDPLFSTAVIMTVAAGVYWIWQLSSGSPVRVPRGAAEWTFVAGVALVATVLPVTTLFVAMRRAGAADTSLISTIEPVATVLLSALLTGELLTANRLVGGALIVGGVISLRVVERFRAFGKNPREARPRS